MRIRHRAARIGIKGLGIAFLAAGCASTSGRRDNARLVPIGAGIQGPAGLRATVYAKGCRMSPRSSTTQRVDYGPPRLDCLTTVTTVCT